MRANAKCRRVLEALSTGQSYNRFEAARLLHDTCLHSTVSTIQKKGVPVSRRMEVVSGYLGARTKCCRYWIELTYIPLALTLLGDDDFGFAAVLARAAA